MNDIVLHREKTVCFTGHRPEKLPDRGDRNSLKTRTIKSMLYYEIAAAVEEGCDTFITGMQRGIDLWAGEAVLSLMDRHSLRIICALPYEGFGRDFTGIDRWTFERIAEAAAASAVICPRYNKDCMALRNKFMVENSSRLIAAMGDDRSGTGQTLRHAINARLDIRMIDLSKMYSKNDIVPGIGSNLREYEVITFESTEQGVPVPSRKLFNGADELPSKAAAVCTAKETPYNPDISGKADEPTMSGKPSMPGKPSNGFSGDALSSISPVTPVSPELPCAKPSEKKPLPQAPHNPTPKPSPAPKEDLELDERYSSADDPSLTLL